MELIEIKVKEAIIEGEQVQIITDISNYSVKNLITRTSKPVYLDEYSSQGRVLGALEAEVVVIEETDETDIQYDDFIFSLPKDKCIILYAE